MTLRHILAAIALIAFSAHLHARPATLDEARAAVREDYPHIQQIAPEALETARREGGVLLLDTRSEKEFAVSRIPGAVRVAPDMDADAFLSRFGEAAHGKAVVFYCSVGARSSAFADRVGEGLNQQGATAVRSLDGGIFAWSLGGRPLENQAGPTAKVHGYDASWGQLLKPPGSR